MFKKISKVCILSILLIILSVPYVSAKDLKIGCVDISEVFDGYEKTKEKNEKLEDITSKKQEEREKMLDGIQKLRKEMQLMSEEGKKEKQDVLREKISELQGFDRKTRGELKKERDEIMKEILEEIKNSIQSYAKKKDYDIILYRNALLYNVKELDVTSKIVDILNANY